MAKISIEELLRGDKYDIFTCRKNTVLGAIKLIKNRESISELETEMDSFYVEVENAKYI